MMMRLASLALVGMLSGCFTIGGALIASRTHDTATTTAGPPGETAPTRKRSAAPVLLGIAMDSLAVTAVLMSFRNSDDQYFISDTNPGAR